MQAVRILLFSEQPLIRQGIISTVAAQPDLRILIEVDNDDAAVSAYIALKPDIVIMDIPALRMCDPLLKSLKSHDPEAKIIVISTLLADWAVTHAVRAGASGVLASNVSTEALIGTIRKVAQGIRMVSVAATVGIHPNLRTKLSDREAEILMHVAQGHTNLRIGTMLGITAETVKTHVKSSIRKLGASNRTGAVAIAIKHGLLGFDAASTGASRSAPSR